MKDSDEFRKLAVEALGVLDIGDRNVLLVANVEAALFAVHNRGVARERELLDRIERPLRKVRSYSEVSIIKVNALVDEALSEIEKARKNDNLMRR